MCSLGIELSGAVLLRLSDTIGILWLLNRGCRQHWLGGASQLTPVPSGVLKAPRRWKAQALHKWSVPVGVLRRDPKLFALSFTASKVEYLEIVDRSR